MSSKTRNRDPLADNYINKRHKLNNQTYYLYTGTRKCDYKVCISNYLKALHAIQSRWSVLKFPRGAVLENIQDDIVEEFIDDVDNQPIDHHEPIKLNEKHLSAIRRKAIEYFFLGLFGAPPKEEWKELDLVNNDYKKIMNSLFKSK